MQSLTAEIGRYSLRLSPVLIGFGLLIILLERWSNSESSTGSTLGVAFFSYLAHRTVLFDLRFGRWGKLVPAEGVYVPPESVGRFLVVSFIHTAIALFVVLPVAWEVSDTFANPDVGALSILPVAALVSWVLLTFLGTIYPAAADHEFPSLRRAVNAGRKTWTDVAWQLLLFPGLYGLVVTALTLTVLPSAGNAERWDPILIVLDALSTAALLEVQVMTAVILTRAYRRAWW